MIGEPPEGAAYAANDTTGLAVAITIYSEREKVAKLPSPEPPVLLAVTCTVNGEPELELYVCVGVVLDVVSLLEPSPQSMTN